METASVSGTVLDWVTGLELVLGENSFVLEGE
jgi:hypothetical protein